MVMMMMRTPTMISTPSLSRAADRTSSNTDDRANSSTFTATDEATHQCACHRAAQGTPTHWTRCRSVGIERHN